MFVQLTPDDQLATTDPDTYAAVNRIAGAAGAGVFLTGLPYPMAGGYHTFRRADGEEFGARRAGQGLFPPAARVGLDQEGHKIRLAIAGWTATPSPASRPRAR